MRAGLPSLIYNTRELKMDTALAIGGSLLATAGAGYLLVKTLCPWLLVDIEYIQKVLPGAKRLERWNKEGVHAIDIFEQCVKKHPDKYILLFEDQKYTYKEMDSHANRIANLSRQQLGLETGDTVILLQHNCPEFLFVVLGLMKQGVAVTLVNTSLRGRALLHCINVTPSKILIVGSDPSLLDSVVEIVEDLPKIMVYVHGMADAALPADFKSLDSQLEAASTAPVPPSVRASIGPNHPSVYIFTSGTTGLPKAAVVPSKRLLISSILSKAVGVCSDDVIYVTMPLFHSSALIVGFFQCMWAGATCVLRKRFSRSQFFPDCRRYGVTVIIYIGEMCRYLLTNDKSADDTNHKVRVAIGNGLRQDIFSEFRTRFKIKHIAEIYGPTEGNVGYLNVLNKDGSIGRASPLLTKLFPVSFCKWDVENECLVRNSHGLCVPADIDEPGLCLGKITPKSEFDGYQGRKELTESKIVRDVLVKGDSYFNTGDLMRRDRLYFLYFCDRIGDTYRWKGENVSTTEVSNFLSLLDFVTDACVYGVHIPGYEGRAGMATLALNRPWSADTEAESLQAILEHCERTLPGYAKPLFLRVARDDLEMTQTVKQTKITLKKQAYDPGVIDDPLFYLDKLQKSYLPLTKVVYADISGEKIPF
ncbi:long-chain fatty acid transport protein 6-like isoform X1 [Mya arenaria]|uniref:long-chain fatty acid transport protein 6-like isoform X1 n=2 Tax=Mya arenaria TaxID=6604 RepID=UPI0022E0046A|nr:long-chain fatty acid transport protein 6-like isoform X1 [Mya arenaria]